MILRIFLIFDNFEPGDSYKKNSYKKTVYITANQDKFKKAKEPLGYSGIVKACIDAEGI